MSASVFDAPSVRCARRSFGGPCTRSIRPSSERLIRSHARETTIQHASGSKAIELWGGLECTINRVHDRYFDQHLWSGHRSRVEEDLGVIATLGIRTLRTALHWEYFDETASWSFFDATMQTMKRLEMRPIVGLLHHGSGPRHTDLLDPRFPEKLARYALLVAQRYPDVLRYTPVNEPNTTSRFACLYGHWYPHQRSMQSYLRALLNEVKATVLAMQAIRTVQPHAELVYTEDGGAIFGTPATESFRVAREHRRWLGTDLLCGRVTAEHPLYQPLLQHGIPAAELAWFEQNECPPSVIGLNYYLTSDRFLDDRVSLYPPAFRGGDSGAEPLVDIEAVRVRPEGIRGVTHVLTEAWNRYGIPVAITEAHLGGSPVDQVRWLQQVWDEAQQAARSGVAVEAVTVWALFGSWNWCNLCTQDVGAYEPGPIDLSSGTPRPTPLASRVEALAHGRAPRLQAQDAGAWWQRPDRILYAEERSPETPIQPQGTP